MRSTCQSLPMRSNCKHSKGGLLGNRYKCKLDVFSKFTEFPAIMLMPRAGLFVIHCRPSWLAWSQTMPGKAVSPKVAKANVPPYSGSELGICILKQKVGTSGSEFYRFLRSPRGPQTSNLFKSMQAKSVCFFNCLAVHPGAADVSAPRKGGYLSCASLFGIYS